MNVVIDASAAVEVLLRTTIGLRVDATIADATLFAPELFDVEVTATLRRELLRGRLTERRAAQALEDLTAWEVERVPHRDLIHTAWSWRHNVSSYDAFYLAAARRLSAHVLTADGPLSRVPVTTGVIVHNLR